MQTDPSPRVDVKALRIGLYVHLDVGWMKHPFPFNSFKISSARQIEVLRGLGIESLRFSPEKSDPEAMVSETAPASEADPVPLPATTDPGTETRTRERESLRHCEQRFANAGRTFRWLAHEADRDPARAQRQVETLVGDMIEELEDQQDSCIRLLSDSMGDRAAQHSVNVMVLSLLLGRTLGMPAHYLGVLGQAALLHDLGKQQLPDRIRLRQDHFSGSELRMYRQHVELGVALAQRMALPADVVQAIAQHHEMADGSGFPTGCDNAELSDSARIIALVNRYDNLCNPPNPVHAVTPHEALSLIFSQLKARFDGPTLAGFVRLMGVYPPGSVVQLSDRRHAIVTQANNEHPLRPRLLVHDQAGGRDRLLRLDLASEPDIDVLRSLHPHQLPQATLQCLSPRQRVCYYFERGRDPATSHGGGQ